MAGQVSPTPIAVHTASQYSAASNTPQEILDGERFLGIRLKFSISGNGKKETVPLLSSNSRVTCID